MKNIHVLPTDKPSRLFKLAGDLHLHKECEIDPKRNQNIYITSDEEIKEGDWCICLENIFKNEIFKVDSDTPNKSSNVTLEFAKKYLTKIILTTDQDLIEDGVQAINDEFLEWFVKNPSCEFVKVIDKMRIFNVDELRERHRKGLPHLYSEKIGYKIIIPREEPKQDYSIITEQTFTKKDLEEAYKTGWRADKTYQSGKESFKQWFKNRFPRKPILFKVKRDLSFYKQNNYEEE